MVAQISSHNLATFSTEDIMRHRDIRKGTYKTAIQQNTYTGDTGERYKMQINLLLDIYPEFKNIKTSEEKTNETDNNKTPEKKENNIEDEEDKELEEIKELILRRLYNEGSLICFPDEKNEKKIISDMLNLYREKVKNVELYEKINEGTNIKDVELYKEITKGKHVTYVKDAKGNYIKIDISKLKNSEFLTLIAKGKIKLDKSIDDKSYKKEEIKKAIKFFTNLRTSKIGSKNENFSDYSILDRIYIIVEGDITEYKTLVDKKEIEELFSILNNSLYKNIKKLEELKNNALEIQLLSLKESYVLLSDIFNDGFKEDDFKANLDNFKLNISKTIKILKELVEN